jgi:adenylate kinase
MQHRILILGPQGSGKGTQAKILADRLGVPALSMGELLREEVEKATEIGLRVKDTLDAGNLVSDEIVLGVFANRIQLADAKNGFVIDSYPRNMAQYRAAKDVFEPTAILLLDVPREESLNRVLKRAKEEGRSDDTPEVIENRLKIYEEETKPMVDVYQQQGLVRYVNGVGTVEEIAARIAAVLHLD